MLGRWIRTSALITFEVRVRHKAPIHLVECRLSTRSSFLVVDSATQESSSFLFLPKLGYVSVYAVVLPSHPHLISSKVR